MLAVSELNQFCFSAGVEIFKAVPFDFLEKFHAKFNKKQCMFYFRNAKKQSLN